MPSPPALSLPLESLKPKAQFRPYLQVRKDTLQRLRVTGRRKQGKELRALGLLVSVAQAAHHLSGKLESWTSTTWAKERGSTWRCQNAAISLLEDAGMLRLTRRPGRPGSVAITTREQPTSALHARERTAETFDPLLHGVIEELGRQHHLSLNAQDLLVGLLELCDRLGELGGDWTKTRLSHELRLGWHSLTNGLGELAGADLIAFRVCRGQKMTFTLTARPCLVPVTQAPPLPPRSERRAHHKASAHSPSEARTLAVTLLRRYGLLEDPTQELVGALGGALATGVSTSALLEGITSFGNLGGLRRVQAGLAARAGNVAEHVAAARLEAQERLETQRAEQARREEAQRLEQETWMTRDAEDRGVSSAILHLPTAQALGLHPLTSGPVPRAMAILSSCRELVEAHPDLDPSQLIARWAKFPCRPQELDTAGIAPRAGGGAGTLPQARTGPTLVERLRAGP